MESKKNQAVIFEISGGCHNAGAISLHIPAERVAKALDILKGALDWQYWNQGEQCDAGAYFESLLSESQIKRLDRHMCGQKDCCCGGRHMYGAMSYGLRYGEVEIYWSSDSKGPDREELEELISEL